VIGEALSLLQGLRKAERLIVVAKIRKKPKKGYGTMSKITINENWTLWFKREKSKFGFLHELEGIERLIQMEREYPFRGEGWLREAIKKKMILKYKIQSLKEEGVL
jgi:ABC-type uncharacterized transport system ATPase component